MLLEDIENEYKFKMTRIHIFIANSVGGTHKCINSFTSFEEVDFAIVCDDPLVQLTLTGFVSI